VTRYKELLAAVDPGIAAVHLTIERLEEEIGEIEDKIAALKTAGHVATEDELKAARRIRDEGWGLVRGLYIDKRSGLDEQVKLLTAIRGIGVWTANYALMKTLKQLQAIPYGDVGLLNALLNHGLIKDKKDTAGIEQLFRRFKGWESYLVFYLWRSLAMASGK
jgi:3-methyladenine DNA glycosylase/8-oxoguanine DNA glycosylase